MALSHRLDLKHSQTLVMTPQLQQAIKLLQMSNLELSAFVEAEIEQNPLLERDDPEYGDSGPDERVSDRDEGVANGTEDPDDGSGAESPALENAEGLPEADAPLGADYEDDWDGEDGDAGLGTLAFDAQRAGSGGRSDFDPLGGGLEATLDRKETLQDHLLQQLLMDIADPAERLIGVHLIGMLDEAGWLAGDLQDVANQLGCPPDMVASVLRRLQGFDPAGIFARTLRECLALQLQDRNRLDPAMEALLDNLDLLARYDRATLMRLCGVDAEDLADMIAEIRALNPKPATAFEHDVTQSVTPDILMRAHPDGGWQVELNSDTLPRVLVNQPYYARVSRDAKRPEDKEYLAECLNSANWLVKALHQRATTILKVASEIVRQQDAFFVHGVTHMRPLILRDVSEVIGMHESTVSRVTSNKYMATPRGIFELKYFFSAALSSANGGMSHSAEAVRFRIRGMCDSESPDAVLSDDDIAERLRADGIDIARRTVAKYREAMHIPSSVQRRRVKKGARV